MINLNDQQLKAYNRFIRARDRVKLVRTSENLKNEWVPMSDYSACVDAEGLNHPLFEVNDEWLEYKEASSAWWAIEPAFRDAERMRASRGDYGKSDSWEDPNDNIKDVYQLVKGQ